MKLYSVKPVLEVKSSRLNWWANKAHEILAGVGGVMVFLLIVQGVRDFSNLKDHLSANHFELSVTLVFIAIWLHFRIKEHFKHNTLRSSASAEFVWKYLLWLALVWAFAKYMKH